MGDIGHIYRPIRHICPRPDQPQVGRAGLGAGGSDILRYGGSVGMGGIHHQGEPLGPEQILHLLLGALVFFHDVGHEPEIMLHQDITCMSVALFQPLQVILLLFRR